MERDIEHAVDVRGVTKSFSGHVVVDHMDMQIPRGEIFGFLGPNGSGKTTFLRMLCGLLKIDSGEGTCLGFDIRKQSEKIKQLTGYMTQRFSLYEDLTVEENLLFIARLYEMNELHTEVEKTLEQFGFLQRRRQLAGELSGGWKQRLSLASCMLHGPKLLLLDEPTAGVDPRARRDFWEEIHRLSGEGITILVTTHYMDEAERCHQLAYIAYGRLIAGGTPQEVTQKAELITYEISGPDLHTLAERLRRVEGVVQTASFGTRLHVSGRDPTSIERAVKPLENEGFDVRPAVTDLEDAFIYFMNSGGRF